MFLAPNTVTYKSPVTDPWFQATIPKNWGDPGGRNDTLYSPDHWVGVLACADQFQFRNPANGKSTPLTSGSLVLDGIPKLQFNNIQMATMTSLYYTVGPSIAYYSVRSRGANSLRASETLSGSDFTQIGLPDNQWMIEAAEMFSVSLAKLQQQILTYATGPPYVHEAMIFVKGAEDICRRQKIRGIGGFLSFSVLGVSIIFVLGGLIILTSLLLEIVVGFVRRVRRWNDHKRLQWAVDEKLQLQRLAFEGAGQGRWTGGTDAVPTTSKDQLFGFGPNPDRDHPRLARNDYYDVNPAVYGTTESEASAMIAADEKTKTTVVTREETGQLLS